ncbi:MAG: type II toxin-antitoxin system RelB/DinJ family antitoxin [Oligosphaeraceae bacterium]
MPTTNICIRMDVEKKREAEELFASLGMSLTTALNVFINQALRERAIPFTISERRSHAETMEAIREARRIACDPKVRSYEVEEALKEMKR